MSEFLIFAGRWSVSGLSCILTGLLVTSSCQHQNLARSKAGQIKKSSEISCGFQSLDDENSLGACIEAVFNHFGAKALESSSLGWFCFQDTTNLRSVGIEYVSEVIKLSDLADPDFLAEGPDLVDSFFFRNVGSYKFPSKFNGNVCLSVEQSGSILGSAKEREKFFKSHPNKDSVFLFSAPGTGEADRGLILVYIIGRSSISDTLMLARISTQRKELIGFINL